MNLAALPRKISVGLPYFAKELRAIISDRTALFIAKPRVVYIWRNAPCNGQCVMCVLGFTQGEALKALSRSAFTDAMVTRVLPQIAALCGRGTVVSYGGGEPTLSPHLLEWVQTAHRLGLDFRFTTNGYRLTPKLAEDLVAGGLFNIGVSLESLNPETNELMRPYPNGTALTVRAIELLRSERRRQRARFSVNVKTVISSLNLNDFLDIVRLWGKEEGMLLTPQPFEAQEGMPVATREALYIRDLSRLERFARQVRQLKREGYHIQITEQGLEDIVRLYREDKDHQSTIQNKTLTSDPGVPRCTIATDTLWIQDGSVRICPYFPPITNLVTDTTTVKQAWESEKCRLIREQTRRCRRLCNMSCLRRTPLRHKVRMFLHIS
jgi:MoaA/NifB/PqqE/SkfB family radical SAM enzyme